MQSGLRKLTVALGVILALGTMSPTEQTFGASPTRRETGMDRMAVGLVEHRATEAYFGRPAIVDSGEPGQQTEQRPVMIESQREDLLIDIKPPRPETISSRILRPSLPVVGERWEYLFRCSSCTSEGQAFREVVEVRGNGFKEIVRAKVDVNGIPATSASEDAYDRDWNQIGEGGSYTFTFSTACPNYSYPMYAGKRWVENYAIKAIWDGEENYIELRQEARAVEWEQVSVPAGTFDALKIEYRRNISSAQETEVALFVLWYAPDVRNWVKRVTTMPSGFSEQSELVRYTRPDAPGRIGDRTDE
jgi:hypothetical protein